MAMSVLAVSALFTHNTYLLMPSPKKSKSTRKPAAKKKESKASAPAPKKTSPSKPAAGKPAAKPAAKASKAPAKKGSRISAAAFKKKLLEKKSARPIAFSLEEVREVARSNAQRASDRATAAAERAPKKVTQRKLEELEKPSQPHHIRPASLTDILGYNPQKGVTREAAQQREVPTKFQRYHKLLVELRDHVLSGLNQHAEDTLKRSSKEDTGDLSSYSQHMADSGTDTFDRDFALSLVSSEQEALSEIEAAIQRIHDGSYGVCELTGKPISKERLLAVPFARYSVESQAEIEKLKRRTVQRGGVFTDLSSEEGGKFMEEDSED